MNATRSDVGIEIAVTNVERHDLKKTKMIIIAKVRPRRPSLTRSEIDFSTNGAWLKVSLMVTLPPSFVASSSSRGLMPLEIDTVFPS